MAKPTKKPSSTASGSLVYGKSFRLACFKLAHALSPDVLALYGQNPADHAHMQRHLQPAVDRFKATGNEEVRSAFRNKLGGYVRMYSFPIRILPYADPDLELPYSDGRFLLPPATEA